MRHWDELSGFHFAGRIPPDLDKLTVNRLYRHEYVRAGYWQGDFHVPKSVTEWFDSVFTAFEPYGRDPFGRLTPSFLPAWVDHEDPLGGLKSLLKELIGPQGELAGSSVPTLMGLAATAGTRLDETTNRFGVNLGQIRSLLSVWLMEAIAEVTLRPSKPNQEEHHRISQIIDDARDIWDEAKRGTPAITMGLGPPARSLRAELVVTYPFADLSSLDSIPRSRLYEAVPRDFSEYQLSELGQHWYANDLRVYEAAKFQAQLVTIEDLLRDLMDGKRSLLSSDTELEDTRKASRIHGNAVYLPFRDQIIQLWKEDVEPNQTYRSFQKKYDFVFTPAYQDKLKRKVDELHGDDVEVPKRSTVWSYLFGR